MVREQRRRQAVEHLEFEREREVALHDQLHDVLGEQLGPQVDEQAYAQMSAEDAAVVRAAISGGAEAAEEDFAIDWEPEPADSPELVEAEIARLAGEIEESRRRQQAFERYVQALNGRS